MRLLQKIIKKTNPNEFQIDICPDNNLDTIIVDFAPVSSIVKIEDFIIDINRNVDLQVNGNRLKEINIPGSIVYYDELLTYLNCNYNDGKPYYTRWNDHCFVIRSSEVVN